MKYGSNENLSSSNSKRTQRTLSKSFSSENLYHNSNDCEDSGQTRVDQVKAYYENLCKAKDEQLETLRASHQRRLERYNSLEKQYKLLKEHLKSYTGSEKSTLPDKNSSNENHHNMAGYTRKDTESLWNENKFFRKENESLLGENFRLKEEIDVLKVKSDEQKELIEQFKMDLDLKLDNKQESYDKLLANCEKELKVTKEKLRVSQEEISSLKIKIDELDKNCDELVDERIKYVDLCTKLSNENKKLYKKWFQTRKTDSKYRMLLIDQMNKYSQAKMKRKVSQRKSHSPDNDENEEMSCFSSAESVSSSMSNLTRNQVRKTNYGRYFNRKRIFP